MGVLRKCVRFHDDNPSDVELYNAVCNFKDYGYRSESNMIIDGLRHLLSDDKQLPPEQLADLIADRLSKRLSFTAPTVETSDESSTTYADQTAVDDAYNAALGFLDTL